MKLSLILSIMFLSLKAFSCPQLAGLWKCIDSSNQRMQLEIQHDGIHYSIKQKSGLSSALEVWADGTPRDENALLFQTKTTAKCPQENNLNIVQNKKVTAVVKSESLTVMDLLQTDDNQFSSHTVSDTQYEGQAPQHAEQDYKCSK